MEMQKLISFFVLISVVKKTSGSLNLLEFYKTNLTVNQSSAWKFELGHKYLGPEHALYQDNYDAEAWKNCSITDTEGNYINAWWHVTLGTVCDISSIKIIFKTGSQLRRKGFKVYNCSLSSVNQVDSLQPIYHDIEKTTGVQVQIIFPGGFQTENILVYTDEVSTDTNAKNNPVLELCKIELIGCPQGMYGTDCQKVCPASCNSGCHPSDGYCYNTEHVPRMHSIKYPSPYDDNITLVCNRLNLSIVLNHSNEDDVKRCDGQRKCNIHVHYNDEIQYYCWDICPQPDLNITNITVTKYLSSAYQKSVHYKCQFGYKLLDGDLNRTCQENRTWSGEKPVCHKIECSENLTVPNASLINYGGSHFFQDTVEYKCNTNFNKTAGNATRVCLLSGEWSEPMTCEEIFCPDPDIFTNESSLHDGNTIQGAYFPNFGYKVGSNITYNCNKDYRYIEGNLNRVCMNTSHWTGSVPRCTRCKCPCSRTKNQLFINDTTILQRKIEALQEELKVNTKQLSGFIRTKTSAADERKSSTQIGSIFGVGILVTIGAAIVLFDIPLLYRQVLLGPQQN